jgi:hypothetical protein
MLSVVQSLQGSPEDTLNGFHLLNYVFRNPTCKQAAIPRRPEANVPRKVDPIAQTVGCADVLPDVTWCPWSGDRHYVVYRSVIVRYLSVVDPTNRAIDSSVSIDADSHLAGPPVPGQHSSARYAGFVWRPELVGDASIRVPAHGPRIGGGRSVTVRGL